MINEKVYSGIRDNSGKLGTFGHGFTYSGHPVSAAVALETLKIYEERDIVGHGPARGARLPEAPALVRGPSDGRRSARHRA